MNSKDLLRRMLMLDSILSIGGIVAATFLYLVALHQQQIITEDLYQHPFTVSNAALELKMDVLSLRNRILELTVGGETVSRARSEANVLEQRISAELTTVQSLFLGDIARVEHIRTHLDAWSQDREQIFRALESGRSDVSRDIATRSAAQHVAQVLTDCEYVISFARDKAANIVDEGKTQQIGNQQLVALGAMLVAAAYIWIASKRRRAIQGIFDQLHVRATRDGLTSAHNRQSFVEQATLEIERTLRLDNRLSLIVIDIDYFKQINDSHGHASGDAVLREFGSICNSILRKIDTFGRLGGEEFGALLPGAALQEALLIAERIRQVTADSFLQSDGRPVQITVSSGVVELGGSCASFDQMMRAADKALYQAKHEGRNRVVCGDISLVGETSQAT